MILNIELTEKEADMLTQILSTHEDNGPYNSGWQSKELIQLSEKVDKAVEDGQVKADNQ